MSRIKLKGGRRVLEDHGMTGSGLFIINPPYGLREELDRLSARMATLTG